MKVYISDDLKFVYEGDFAEGDVVLVNSKTGSISSLKFSKIRVKNSETIIIDDVESNINDIVIKHINDIGKEYMKVESIYIKSIEDCLPPTDNLPLIYKVAVNAMKKTMPTPLTQVQHNRKLGHIRSLYKIAEGDKSSMSINKLEELLSFYGLTMDDILKDEFK